MSTLGLRIDIDFAVGLRKGVPFLLDTLRRHEMLATFFVTMGPDGFGHNTQRVRTPGYLKRLKALRPLNIVRRFGPLYLARHALGISGLVGSAHPEILRAIREQGHEIGPHGYDHFWWAENVWQCPPEAVRSDMEDARRALEAILGERRFVWASPNWRCSVDVLREVDRWGAPYGADCRGRSPFVPRADGYIASRPQIPISLPCLHEVRQALDSSDHGRIAETFLANLKTDKQVWCVHGYYEGVLERELFLRVLSAVLERGYRIVPLRDLAAELSLAELPTCDLVRLELPGGRGAVSFQGPDLAGSGPGFGTD